MLNFFETQTRSWILKQLIYKSTSTVSNNQIIYIQKKMKILVQKRLNLYEKILELWNISEKNMYSQIILHNTSGETITMNKLKKISMIPRTLKLQKIKEKIKETMRFYCVRMKNYNSSKMLFQQNFMNFSWYNTDMLKINQEKPNRPNIMNEFTDDILQLLIKQSMKEQNKLRTSLR